MLISAHAGFPRWIDSGADFIEIDVRRDDRGVIVDSHDAPQAASNHHTFDEIVEAVAGRIGLHLDLKEAGYERELIGRALERFAPDRIVATPDFQESVRTIKEHFPGVRVSPVDFVVLEEKNATDYALRWLRRPVWVWTVDDRKRMKRLMEKPRVEGIITNRPDLALELRKARA